MLNISLKIKALLILIGVFILSGVVEYVIQQQIVYPSFIALENSEAKKNLKRAVQAINREMYHLDATTHDWAAWDETYDFIVTANQEYIDTNLVDSTFTGNAVNLMVLTDTSGRVVWKKVIDLATKEETTLAGFSANSLPGSHPLLTFPPPETPLSEAGVKGVIMTEKGPMLVSSRPVITSNNQGPVRGFFIFGRLLNAPLVEVLKGQTQVDFTITVAGEIEPGDSEDRQNTSFAGDIFTMPEDHFANLFTFQDLTGRDAFHLTAKTPRTISRQGVITIRYAILSIAIAAVLFLIIAMLLLQRSILGPVSDLTRHLAEITRTGDLSARINMQRNDEIGKLADQFDGMMDELEYDKKEMDALNEALHTDIQHQKLMALEQSRRELVKRESMRKELLSHTVIAQEKERMRIARELHDETSQALTAAAFTLEALKESLPDNAEAFMLVERLRRIDDKMALDLQRMIKNLRPAELDHLGLVAAIRSLAEEVSRNSGIKVSVKVGGTEQRLDRLIETVLYRAAQEALTNVTRYAHTDEAIIGLQFEADRTVLVIHDDGKGFDTTPLKTSRRGWGIEGMRERVESVGGHFELYSAPGRGTTIEIVVKNGVFA